jgi:hypothetical protein
MDQFTPTKSLEILIDNFILSDRLLVILILFFILPFPKDRETLSEVHTKFMVFDDRFAVSCVILWRQWRSGGDNSSTILKSAHFGAEFVN